MLKKAKPFPEILYAFQYGLNKGILSRNFFPLLFIIRV